MFLILSWRNIWRNKKRTIIVAASVFFAVVLSAIMRSGQLGSYEYMIESSTKMFTGYLQIQDNDYWDKKSLDNSFVMENSFLENVKGKKHITHVTPRLEAFALISSDTITRVAQVVGIHPEYEDELTEISSHLKQGVFLNQNSQGILIGASLAGFLNVAVGDTLTLYGVGYHGTTAAALLPVQGILKMPFKSMDNAMTFIALPKAQEIFSCEKHITSLPVMIDNIANINKVRDALQSELDSTQVIMSWNEMMPDLEQSIEVDNIGGIISLGVLYIVIAFGIFGTIMMMVSERAREFAVLIAVGMRKSRLIIVTALESVILSFLGVITGIIASIPIVQYLVYHPIYMGDEYAEMYESFGIEPIMKFSAQPWIFTSQALTVLIIALITIIYPILYIRKMNIAKQIRG
ncbi:MAG: ABC transporter permease [Calditrichaceae bacterium]|nr:ABC transporter permease [Calditrichaceae bacterium]MBN2707613.1 ABC transporter permease [Calditrichaceae bacterium]RQV93211.1 MAG: ABC transporter permease [Calditrichota bacterium]